MVTDTAFKKSRLGKLILEKILPGTSKNWPYHTELLVLSLKFKLSLVCEYLNYCYNTTNDCWTIPEKSKQGGLRTYFLKKKHLDLWGLSLYPWQFWTKQNLLYPWKSCKTVLHPLEIPRSKAKTHESATWFLDHPYKFRFSPRKFWTKQSFALANSVKLCYTLWSTLEIALLFQLTPRILNMIFLQYPRKFHVLKSSLPPLFGFLNFSLSTFRVKNGKGFR